jgi:hypothetical protein
MDDLYCPACRLVLYRRGVGQIAPRHCPRCTVQRRRRVTLLALDRLPPADPESQLSNGASNATRPRTTVEPASTAETA